MRQYHSPSILRLAEVILLTGLSRSSIYSFMTPGSKYFSDFPRPVKIGTRAVGWIAEEVFTWIATRK